MKATLSGKLPRCTRYLPTQWARIDWSCRRAKWMRCVTCARLTLRNGCLPCAESLRKIRQFTRRPSTRKLRSNLPRCRNSLRTSWRVDSLKTKSNVKFPKNLSANIKNTSRIFACRCSKRNIPKPKLRTTRRSARHFRSLRKFISRSRLWSCCARSRLKKLSGRNARLSRCAQSWRRLTRNI